MLEELRQDMVTAFRAFSKKDCGRREAEWEFYCKCRENFLKESARLNNTPYSPLKFTVQRPEKFL